MNDKAQQGKMGKTSKKKKMYVLFTTLLIYMAFSAMAKSILYITYLNIYAGTIKARYCK